MIKKWSGRIQASALSDLAAGSDAVVVGSILSVESATSVTFDLNLLALNAQTPLTTYQPQSPESGS
jgi:hypothetical protein